MSKSSDAGCLGCLILLVVFIIAMLLLGLAVRAFLWAAGF